MLAMKRHRSMVSRRVLERHDECADRVPEQREGEDRAAAEAVGQPAERDACRRTSPANSAATKLAKPCRSNRPLRGRLEDAGLEQPDRDIGGEEQIVELEPAAERHQCHEPARVSRWPASRSSRAATVTAASAISSPHLLIYYTLVVVRSEACECSERREEFAVTLDRACDFAALHGTPHPGIHPGDHRRVEIALQEIDVVDAAPAAAGNVDAVGTLLALKIGLARQIVFRWYRQPADFCVAFDAERVVVRLP